MPILKEYIVCLLHVSYATVLVFCVTILQCQLRFNMLLTITLSKHCFPGDSCSIALFHVIAFALVLVYCPR